MEPNDATRPRNQLKNAMGYDRTRLKQKDLQKSLCTFFCPFREYFHPFRNGYLRPPVPTYSEKNQWDEKIHLSFNKQMQYLRGANKFHIEQDMMKNMIDKQSQCRGTVENIKNRSYFFQGSQLFYGFENELKCATIQLATDSNSITYAGILQQQSKSIYKCSEPILQILPVEFQQKSNTLLVIRSRHWLYLYSIKQQAIRLKVRVQEEITSIACSPFHKYESILITTYDGAAYGVYKWNIFSESQQDRLSRIGSQVESFWHANSSMALNQRQYLIGFSNKICIYDSRKSRSVEFKRVKDSDNDRFVSLCSGNTPEQIICGRRKFVDILDLRFEGRDVASFRHMCEQSPPSILQPISLEQPFIVGYSPYQYGSSLLFRTKTPPFLLNPSSGSSLYSSVNYNTQLLFDSGKLYKNIHPYSISTQIVNAATLHFIHIDSSQGIYLQTMKWNQQLSELERVYPQVTQETNQANMPNFSTIIDPNRRWVRDQVLKAYIVRQQNDKGEVEDNSDSSSNQSLAQEGIFRRKGSFCGLQNLYNRIKQMAKIDGDRKEMQKMSLDNTFPSQNMQCEQNWNTHRHFSVVKGGQEIDEDFVNQIQNNWEI